MSRVIDLLEDYALWDDMIRRKRKQIETLRDNKTSTKITYSDAPTGEPESLADYVAKKEELEEDLEELKHKRFVAFSQIMRLAFKLRSRKQLDIIYRRNIHRDSWRRICRDLDISRSAATDLHARAVRAMEQIDNESGRDGDHGQKG